MRAVVVGATGFLGAALARHLAGLGHQVDGMGSGDLDLRAPAAAAELSARLGVHGVPVLCSALTPPRASSLDGFGENLAMVASVARAVEDGAPPACVYVSSDGVYAWTETETTEETPPRPVGYYAAAKYAGEAVLRTACGAAGVPLLVLRPSAVFGPGDPHRAYGPNRFAGSAQREGRIVLLGTGDERRDHLYVEDFAAYASALIAGGASGTFNLASGTSRTFAEVAEAIRALVGPDVRIERAPAREPVRHRSFDVTRLLAAAPAVSLTPFGAALEATLAGA
jgi:UDP-glucose 4-epimerase